MTSATTRSLSVDWTGPDRGDKPARCREGWVAMGEGDRFGPAAWVGAAAVVGRFAEQRAGLDLGRLDEQEVRRRASRRLRRWPAGAAWPPYLATPPATRWTSVRWAGGGRSSGPPRWIGRRRPGPTGPGAVGPRPTAHDPADAPPSPPRPGPPPSVLAGRLRAGPGRGRPALRPLPRMGSGGIHSAKVNLVASLGNDDHAITRRGCSAPGSE